MIRIIIHNYNNHTMSSFLSHNAICRLAAVFPTETSALSHFFSKLTSSEINWRGLLIRLLARKRFGKVPD